QRLGSKSGKQYRISSANETRITDNFPKGTYVITVKNLVDGSEEGVQDQVTIGIGEDPQGVRSNEFSFRTYGGMMLGKYDQSNFFFPEGYSSDSSYLTSGG